MVWDMDMFGKGKPTKIDENENKKIKGRLDDDESIVMSARQSRIKPGGARVLTPNSIFVTEKRIIIRNPVRLGIGENIEEYFYHQITNVRLEKGVLSASLVFHIPGLTEMSKIGRKATGPTGGGLASFWGRSAEGVIDAIPKKIAEEMYNYIREKIAEIKKQKEEGKATPTSTIDDPIKILKTRYAKGEISKEEFEEMKKDLE